VGTCRQQRSRRRSRDRRLAPRRLRPRLRAAWGRAGARAPGGCPRPLRRQHTCSHSRQCRLTHRSARRPDARRRSAHHPLQLPRKGRELASRRRRMRRSACSPLARSARTWRMSRPHPRAQWPGLRRHHAQESVVSPASARRGRSHPTPRRCRHARPRPEEQLVPRRPRRRARPPPTRGAPVPTCHQRSLLPVGQQPHHLPRLGLV